MVSGAEPLVTAATADGAVSIWGAALRLGGAMALIVGAAAAWMLWQRRIRGGSQHLEVLDRAFLARGVSVALLRVGDRQLLVGVSNDGVRLLQNIEGDLTAPSGRRSFTDILNRSVEIREAGR